MDNGTEVNYAVARMDENALHMNQNEQHAQDPSAKSKSYQRQWYLKNRDRLLARQAERRLENLEDYRARKRANSAAWRAANLEKYRKLNREGVKRRRAMNPEKARAYDRKFRENPKHRVADNFRRRVNRAMRRGAYSKSWESQQLTGCSWDELKIYIERQFTGGMTWENYGDTWHIDHIIPCSKFNLTRRGEQQMCFHYSNLRPLCAKQNRSENARKGVPQQSTFLHLLNIPPNP